MTNKEIRDELSKMLKELRKKYISEGQYYPSDLVRGTNQQAVPSGCAYPSVVKVQYDYEESSKITVGLIKQLQVDFDLEDTDSLVYEYNEDYDDFCTVALKFSRAVKETDIEYSNRIKELYLAEHQNDKVLAFILDIKKSTGVDTPYYAAKKMLEIISKQKEKYLDA